MAWHVLDSLCWNLKEEKIEQFSYGVKYLIVHTLWRHCSVICCRILERCSSSWSTMSTEKCEWQNETNMFILLRRRRDANFKIYAWQYTLMFMMLKIQQGYTLKENIICHRKILAECISLVKCCYFKYPFCASRRLTLLRTYFLPFFWRDWWSKIPTTLLTHHRLLSGLELPLSKRSRFFFS